jgi:methylenetetrahydrofolate reductase (NADPH)
MRISQAYGPDRFGLSFEFFPPKTDAGCGALYKQVAALMAFRPSYITCTYGAGGTTRDRTLEVVQAFKEQFQVPVASHLTCVGSTVADLRQYLRRARDGQVDNIVALRGDPPRGANEFQPVDGGLRYANQLVSLIRDEFPNFGIAVGGYPETHQEAPNPEVELQNLRRKVDCGAEVVITQLFYDNADFFRFRERCEQAGIQVPIVPGLLPITNLSQVQRITSLCHARLPSELVQRLSQQAEDEWQFSVGVEFAARQLEQLLEHEIPGVHFYVLNKARATSQILEQAGFTERRDSALG